MTGNRPILVLSHHPRHLATGALHTTKVVWLDSGDAAMDASSGFFHAVIDRDVVPRLRAALRQWPCARILVSGAFALWRPLTLALLAWNRFGPRRPVFVYWHETAMNLRRFAGADGGTLWSRWKARRRLAAARWLLDDAHVQHLATSRQAKQCLMLLLGVEPDAITIVYEAIARERYVPPPPVSERREWRLAGAGLLDHRKGFDRFIALAEAVPELNGASTRFTWYGGTIDRAPSALRARCEALVDAGRLALPGYADPLHEALATQDLFLMVSRDDPFPLVALEAMAMDLPVLATETTGTAEVLPPALVASDAAALVTVLRRFVAEEAHYPAGTFRNIAANYDRAAFLTRFERAVNRVEGG